MLVNGDQRPYRAWRGAVHHCRVRPAQKRWLRCPWAGGAPARWGGRRV